MSLVKIAGRVFLNKVLGVMSPRQISAATLKAGRKLTDTARQGVPLDNKTIGSIFSETVPCGMKTPRIISSGNELKEFLADMPCPQNIKELAYKNFTNSAQAMAIKTPKESAIYVSKRASSNKESLIGMVTHEFRHFLDLNYAKPNSFMAYIITKLPKRLQVKLASMLVPKDRAADYMKRYLDFQKKIALSVSIANPGKGIVMGKSTDALKTSNKKVVKYWRKLIQNEIKGFSKKEKLKFLGFMMALTKSEAAAYSQGGRVARLYAHQGLKGESPAEILGMLQKQFLEALKLENATLKAKLKTTKSFSQKKYKFIHPPKVIRNISEQVWDNPDCGTGIRTVRSIR